MKNPILTATHLIVLLTAAIVCISFAKSTNYTLISNTGKILPIIIWDNCDQIDNWIVHSSKAETYQGDNTIEVDAADKVEGSASLRMTWAATSSNWGGYFAKSGLWDFSKTPMMRMRFKAQNQLPSNFKFAIRTGAPGQGGKYSEYNILDKITSIGEWLVINIDLRLPDSGEAYPDLTKVGWIEFNCWSMRISEPKLFNIDFIEVLSGPILPLYGTITPETAFTEVAFPLTFAVKVKGGVEPYSYGWYVNGQKQAETSSSFTYMPEAEGIHTVECIITDAEGSSTSVSATVKAITITSPQPSPPSADVFKSDIRGAFVQNWMLRNPDWTRIAETCLNYGINTIVIEITPTEIWDVNAWKVKYYPPLRTAIDVFHSYGFNVHVLFLVGTHGYSGVNAVHSDGSAANWVCFTKNASRQFLKAMIESIVRDYNPDGFMFDYTRYDGTDMCFCEECKARFIADTGLIDVNWPADCRWDGRYFWNFVEWRANVITEFVGEAVQLMRAIKPDILISAAVFTAFSNCGNYWVMEIAQHTADWIDKGYLDFVSPMIYTSDVEGAVSMLQDSMNFYTGGAEGKIPMVPFISLFGSGDPYTPMPVDTWVELVRQLKQNGADGWIFWRYGGPGFENDPFKKFTDCRPLLASLINAGLMQPVWAIQNIEISVNATHATISWSTTVPTNATIEYAAGKIFYGQLRYGDFGRPIYYKDINYNSSVTKIQNSIFATEHQFTIPLASEMHFRIKCVDENGSAALTTKELIIEATF